MRKVTFTIKQETDNNQKDYNIFAQNAHKCDCQENYMYFANVNSVVSV